MVRMGEGAIHGSGSEPAWDCLDRNGLEHEETGGFDVIGVS